MTDRKDLEVSYALGAYEIMRYLWNIAEDVDNVHWLKALIHDELVRSKSKLHDIIMKDEEEKE